MQCVPSLVQESLKCLLDLPDSCWRILPGPDPPQHTCLLDTMSSQEIPVLGGFPQPKGQLQIFLANRHLVRKAFPFYYSNGGSGRWHSWHWRCCIFCCTGAQRADTQLGGHRVAQPRVAPTVPLLCQHCMDSNRQGTHSTSSFYSRGKVSSFSQHLVSTVHFLGLVFFWNKAR